MRHNSKVIISDSGVRRLDSTRSCGYL